MDAKEFFEKVNTDILRYESLAQNLDKPTRKWTKILLDKYEFYTNYFKLTSDEKLKQHDSFAQQYSAILHQEETYLHFFKNKVAEELAVLDQYAVDFSKLPFIKKEKYKIQLIARDAKHIFSDIQTYFEKVEHLVEEEKHLASSLHRIKPRKFEKKLQVFWHRSRDNWLELIKVSQTYDIDITRYKGKAYDELSKEVKKILQSKSIMKTTEVTSKVVAIVCGLAAALSDHQDPGTYELMTLLGVFVGTATAFSIHSISEEFHQRKNHELNLLKEKYYPKPQGF